ncbi:MAG: serine protease, partial [Alphaproteobacteria bacterium]|nr:serine protease [Alphaproteobacteria bacterium]
MHPAIIRVWLGREVIGGGFLAAPGIVLTCAHVVRVALGLDDGVRPKTGRKIEIDFPAVRSGQKVKVRLLSWRPFKHDVAALGIDPDLTADIEAAPLAASPTLAVDAEFHCYGFPGADFRGRSEKGKICGVNADGLIEIRPEQSDHHACFVTQGFSGTPAFVNGRVAGMVAEARPERIAHLLPISVLEQAWPPLASPYRGLAPFDEESARWFRGRDFFIKMIDERLTDQPVVAVVGASGCGKSSVVRAGVVPARRRKFWHVAYCRIEDRPLYNLAYALVPLLYRGVGPGERVERATELETRFRTDVRQAFDHVVALLDSGTRLLVVLDQFEELVTRTAEADRASFDAILTHLIAQCGNKAVRVVLTLRSDYVDAFEGLACARYLLNDGQVRVTPMNRTEVLAAIRTPAADLGITFADGMDAILADRVAQEPALLPLLQYALEKSWPKIENDVIPAAALDRFEDLLGQHANQVLDKMDSEARGRAKTLFTRKLVNVTEGGIAHDTKRTATRTELGDTLWETAQAFAGERIRLLVVDQKEGADSTVEIVHEVLIRNWATLAEWLNEVRDLRVWEADLRRQMATSGPDDIWNPTQVAKAEDMRALHEIDPGVRDFAQRMLANTSATDLWSKLRGEHGYAEAIKSLPSISPSVRNTMIGLLMARVDCAEAFLRSVKRTADGLFGNDQGSYLRVAAWTAMLPRDDEPRPLLRARCLLGIVLGLPLDCDSLIAALLATTDSDQRRALGEALTALAPRLEQPERHTDALLEAVRATKDPDQRRAIGEALAALAPRLEQPERRADALLEARRATTD